MDLGLAGLISGGMQAAGGIFGGLLGSGGQSATNAQSYAMFQQQMQFAQAQQQQAQGFNHDEAELSRNWQAEMSNTAYQRSMRDMRAAGLNPILAANLGGASTPGGASGSISGAAAPGGPSLGNPGESLSRGAQSAGQAAATAAATKAVLTQAEKDDSQVKVNETTADYNKSNTNLNKTLENKAQVDTANSAEQMRVAMEQQRNLAADTGNKNIQSMILSHDANTAFEKSRMAKYEADQSGTWGPGIWGNIAGTVGKTLGHARDWLKGQQWGVPQGDVNNQPGTHSQRGVTVHASPPAGGSGLQIDMRR